MPALAKARLYKMTGPDPSMNHKMVFRLGPCMKPILWFMDGSGPVIL